jgi:hypothetical protein
VKFNDGLFVRDYLCGWQKAAFLASMLRFVIARTEACPNLRSVMSLPDSSLPHEGHVASVLRSPRLLMRETLAGVITALALIPEVISFSVVAGVDPKVSLIASVVLCLALSMLGGSGFRGAGDWPDGASAWRAVHFAGRSAGRGDPDPLRRARHGATDALYSAVGDDRVC